jgi:hypothetical protein
MNANYSYIGSQTSSNAGRSDKPRLLNDAPNLFNIGPTFNRGPLAMQMNINYNGASIYYYQYTDGAPGGFDPWSTDPPSVRSLDTDRELGKPNSN